MISKRIHPTSWFRDTPVAHLIGVHSRGGMDRGQLQKIAAADSTLCLDVKPEKGKSFVHLITTGAGEFYGPNNNADYFNKCARDYQVPEPCPGTPAVIPLHDGLEGFHNSFLKLAHVYREHHNSRKGGRPLGDIVAETFNPRMNRGELIVKLANDEWADDLQKLATGGSVYWSMGCGVPYDICMQCGNKAPTRNEYCQHMKYAKLQLTKEGHQIAVINDQPHFHDISRVAVPADRIAFALSKVASVSDSEHGFRVENDGPLWLPVSVVEKIGSNLEYRRAKMLEKLAEIEKRILMQGMAPDEEHLCEAFGDEDVNEDEVARMQNLPLSDLISSLGEGNIMLPPKAFMRVVSGKQEADIPGIDGLPCSLKHVFSDMVDEGDTEVLSDGSYEACEGSPKPLDTVAENLTGRLSMDNAPVRRRIMIVALNGGPSIQKQARLVLRPQESAESRYLAREYAKYQLSYLTGVGRDKHAHRVVLHNQVAQ